jgi:hypothetical protein
VAGHICITVSDLSKDEEREFRSLGVGSIKRFRRSGEIGYSLCADVVTPHAEDAVQNLRAVIEEHGKLRLLLRGRGAQLSVVLEGSDQRGFPSISFSLDTMSFLSDLKASVDIDLYCVDAEVRPE